MALSKGIQVPMLRSYRGGEMTACCGVAAFLKSEETSSPPHIWCCRDPVFKGSRTGVPAQGQLAPCTMQSPNPTQRPPWRFWNVLAMWIRSVCLQTSKQLSVLSSTTKVTTRWDWYQKMARTQKQAGPKMFWRQRWCTLCLRGEGRNRQELTPVNTYPDDRQARVATWKWINFHPSLK